MPKSWGDYSCKEARTLATIMGGANFYNDETPNAQYAVLEAFGANAIRMAVYPHWYLTAGTDNAVVYALKRDKNILYQCEYLPSYPVPPDRSYNTWFDIGRNLAILYSPGSAVLTCRGLPRNKGVTQWSAINEPDTDQLLIVDYRDMMMGYADGIHSANPAAKVYPGGYLSTNRDAEYTGNGYILTIVDLIKQWHAIRHRSAYLCR